MMLVGRATVGMMMPPGQSRIGLLFYDVLNMMSYHLPQVVVEVVVVNAWEQGDPRILKV